MLFSYNKTSYPTSKISTKQIKITFVKISIHPYKKVFIKDYEGAVSHNTPSQIVGSGRIHSFSDFQNIIPVKTFWGGHTYLYEKSLLSLDDITTACTALCQKTQEGEISKSELQEMEKTITELDIAGNNAILRTIQRIFPKFTFFGLLAPNQATVNAKKALSNLEKQTDDFKNQVIASLRTPSPNKHLCVKIQNKTLYTELLSTLENESILSKQLQNIIETQAFDTCIKKLSQSPLPKTQEMRDFVNKLPLSDEQRKKVGLRISTYFFTNATIKSFSSRMLFRDELQEKATTITLCKLIIDTFGSTAFSEVAAPFKEEIIPYFIWIAHEWIKEFKEKKSSDLFALLTEIHRFDQLIKRLYPNDPQLNDLHKEFQPLYQEFFKSTFLFKQQCPFIAYENPQKLSDHCSSKYKDDVNTWLESLEGANQIILDVPRTLPEGFTLGTEKITLETLEAEFGKINETDNDFKSIVSWLLFKKIVSYLEKNNVPNPEKTATSLLALSTQAHASPFVFFPSIADIAGQFFLADSAADQKNTFFCENNSAFLRREYVFKNREDEKFLVVNILQPSPDQKTFSEEISCSPIPPPSE